MILDTGMKTIEKIVITPWDSMVGGVSNRWIVTELKGTQLSSKTTLRWDEYRIKKIKSILDKLK